MKQMLLAMTVMFFLLTAGTFLGAQEDVDDSDDINDTTLSYTSSLTGFDVGGLLGIPSGFIMRYWFTDYIGIGTLAGFSLDSEPLIGVDLLYKPFGIFNIFTLDLYLTIGAGLMVSYYEHEAEYIMRYPVGLTIPLENYPVQFTIYGAPAVVMNKPIHTELQWGIAVSYSFSRGKYLFEQRERAINQNWKFKRDIDGLKSGLKDTKGRLSKTETDLEKTRGKLSDTEGELSSIKNKLGATRKEISQLQNTLTSTKDELDTTRTTLDVVKIRLDGAKEDLNRTRQKLNEKERDLKQNQEALNRARQISKTVLEGKELEEEEKKLAQKQNKLNKDYKQLAEQQSSLEKGNKQEIKARNVWKDKCTRRRGVINNDGECVCRVGETWNSKKNSCVCITGYKLNRKTDRCDPCSIVNISGRCVSRCGVDENKVAMKTGPHKFVCVKKCRGRNEVWIRSSNKCACKDGYNYDSSNKCVPRR